MRSSLGALPDASRDVAGAPLDPLAPNHDAAPESRVGDLVGTGADSRGIEDLAGVAEADARELSPSLTALSRACFCEICLLDFEAISTGVVHVDEVLGVDFSSTGAARITQPGPKEPGLNLGVLEDA